MSYLFDSVASLWRSFVFLLRVLWVCRVSTASALAGLLLFGVVVQAQNLLADTSFGLMTVASARHWLAFFLGLFFLWAFPIHYAARRALDDDVWIATAALRRRLEPWDLQRICFETRQAHPTILESVPRILGLMPFLAVAIGLWGADDAILGAAALPDATAAMLLIAMLGVADAVAAILFLLLVVLREDIVRNAIRRLNRMRPAQNDGRHLMAVFTNVSLVATALLYLLAYLAPIWIAAHLPRAALVPLLLGSLVLVLGWLVRKSYQHGVPYLLLFCLLAAVITGLNTRFNDMRGLDPATVVHTGPRQVDIGQAIQRWKSVNCSSDGTLCPPVLLVAADGGASRAAFITASVVGEILDREALADPSKAGGPGSTIFAISGVSGGAFGAVAIRAALADAAEQGGRPPCRRGHMSWYLNGDDTSLPQYRWRDCLQAVVSGDFLSPVFVGLAFRDNLAPPRWLTGGLFQIDDRAVLLEQAWERHYDYIVHDTRTTLGTGDYCRPTSSQTGLCRRFGYLDVTSPAKTWLPILALNGTSVDTGRRVITTDLASTADVSGGGPDPLYPEAFDLFEMRSTPCRLGVKKVAQDLHCTKPADGPDLLLSTAALNSARFPIVSPAGAVWAQDGRQFGDRVVDGGYFENSGLTTVLDIARIVHNSGLTPIVLTISNEPDAADAKLDRPPRPAKTPDIGPSALAGPGGLANRIFGLITSPVATVLDTRDGHGSEARETAFRTFEGFRPLQPGRDPSLPQDIMYFHIGMAAEAKPLTADAASPTDRPRCAALRKPISMTKVSMSWWLSYTVQADIDAQLCTQENQATFAALMARLRSPQKL